MKKNSKKKIKIALRILVMVLAGAFLGSQIYLWNAKSLGGDAMPMPLGFGMSVVLSGSMEPELSVGDLLIIVRDEEYALRDVVVFQDGRSLTVHRIVGVDGTTVTTKGDANNGEDDPIERDLIKGKVVFAVPFLGTLVNIIKTPIGTVVVLGAALLLLERSFRREKEKDSEQLEQLKEEIRKLKEETQDQT